MLHGYDRSLKVVLRHRFITLVFSNLIFAATIYLFVVDSERVSSQRGYRPDLRIYRGGPGNLF